MNSNSIIILLATYNGAQFLFEQLESIINQTYTNWSMIVRDDGSTDNTVTIIKQYVEKDSRISLLQDDFGNLRSCQNFSKLMVEKFTE